MGLEVIRKVPEEHVFTFWQNLSCAVNSEREKKVVFNLVLHLPVLHSLEQRVFGTGVLHPR